MKLKHTFGLALRWLLGCAIFVVATFFAVKVDLVQAPQNYVVVGRFADLRLYAAFAWLFGFSQALAFGARWLESEAEKLYQPLLVGLVAAVAALIAFTLTGSDPSVTFGLVAIGANLVATVAAARIRRPLPPIHRRGLILLATFVVSAIGWYLLSSKQLDFPHDAQSAGRHRWAVDTVGKPYEAAAAWATECVALQTKLGAPLNVAPAKKGKFRIDRSVEPPRVTIDLAVHGADASGTCEFDARIEQDVPGSGAPDEEIARCELPGVAEYRIPRDCDCTGCTWACDDPYRPVLPHEGTLPANMPAVLVFDRVLTCPMEAVICDISTRSDTSSIRLFQVDDDTRDEVPVTVETLREGFSDQQTYKVSFDEPLIEGASYELTWEESVCGTTTYEFTASAEKPLKTRLVVKKTDDSNIVELSLESEQPWVDETRFELRLDALITPWEETTELPCDEPGPTEVDIVADPLLDERLIARRTLRYQCPEPE